MPRNRFWSHTHWFSHDNISWLEGCLLHFRAMGTSWVGSFSYRKKSTGFDQKEPDQETVMLPCVCGKSDPPAPSPLWCFTAEALSHRRNKPIYFMVVGFFQIGMWEPTTGLTSYSRTFIYTLQMATICSGSCSGISKTSQNKSQRSSPLSSR